MSSLSGAGNDGSDPEICTAHINDAQQLNLMEEGHGSQNSAYDAGAGAHANMDAAVSSIDPPMSDSQTIVAVTGIAAQHGQMVINSALMPPMSDSETIAAVIDVDAQCDQMNEEIKGIGKRASPIEPPLPDNTAAATIDPRIDEEMGTDLAGVDMTSDNSGQVNLEGGEHVLDDEGSEIANTTVGQTTPRDTVGQTAPRSQKRRRGAITNLCMVQGSDDAQGQGPIQGSPAPQAAGRVEGVSDGATQGPSAESTTRASNALALDPCVPIVEAMLVEDEIQTAQVHPTSVYEATRIPNTLPVPWWKRHQKYLNGVSAAILVAFGVALGQVLSPDDPPAVLLPSDSNSTLPSASKPTYYPDRIKKLCSNHASGQGNSSDQILFETAESCCEEVFWDYQDECLVNSPGTSHRPSSPPSDSPTIFDVPSSPPSETPSSSPTSWPSSYPSMRPTTQLQSSALRLVTSENVVGGHDYDSAKHVAVQGDTAVIGAPFNDNERGAAFVLNRDESGWSQLAKLEAPDGEWGDRFGQSVAIDGNTIVVGADGDDSGEGSVHVFTKINGSWQYQARLIAPDRDADFDDDSFDDDSAPAPSPSDPAPAGRAIGGGLSSSGGGSSSSGRMGAIVDPSPSSSPAPAFDDDSFDDDSFGDDSFDDDYFDDDYFDDDFFDDDSFGFSVGIHKDRVVVGAVYEDSNGTNAGAAYVFVRNETTWVLESKLLAPAGDAGDEFGWTVEIFGDAIIVGAPSEDAGASVSGAAHMYSRTSGGSWEHRAMLFSPHAASGDGFGASVGIHGNRVIVGAPGDDSNGEDAGASFVFADDGSAWTLETKLLAPDKATDDRFGESVGIFDGTAVVGSPRDDDNGWYSGAAHVYELAQGAWSHRAKVLAPHGAAYDWFGRSVAVHNGTVIAHSHGSGETFVFSE